MPRLAALGTALPPHCYSQETVRAYCRELFGNLRRIEDHLAIFDHAGVETRYLSFPPEYYLAAHPFSRRNQDYVQQATELAERALRACLASAVTPPDGISHLLLVTTTGLATPSLDAYLIPRIPLSASVRRTPIFGVGCAGGAVGLARARELALAAPRSAVLLVAVELCGQTFQLNDRSTRNLIATSLFGEGAAAVLIVGDGRGGTGPRLLDASSLLFPDSLEAMGWEFTEEGMRLLLSPQIPRLVRQHMRQATEAFLASHGLTLQKIQHFIIHPGGPKILQAYEEVLGLSPQDLRWSREVLRKFGNQSSASILFVLNEILEQAVPRPGDYGLLVAMGPGFSAEQLLLQW